MNGGHPPLRIALITRSFWPQTGGAEKLMGRLALGLQERGAEIQIVTAQWNPTWPVSQDWYGVRLTRIPQPKRRFWGTYRYLGGLSRWLRHHRESIDVVYVSMLKQDAYVTVRQCRHRSVPVVLRAEGGGLGGDAQWQDRHWLGRWIRKTCQTADAIVAPSDQIEQELLARHYESEQVHWIPNGVPIPPRRTPQTREQARQVLSTVSHQWAAIADCPWIVFTGRLVVEKGLRDLVAAWPLVEREFPRAKLLLVGEGPAQATLVADIHLRGLEESVLLPGAFLDTGDLLAAADLFVLPSYEEGLSLALLEALAAEVPVVGTDIPGIREVMNPHGSRWLVRPHEAAALAEAILDLLRNPESAQNWARSGRKVVAQSYCMSDVVEAHWQLFESLLTRKRGQ